MYYVSANTLDYWAEGTVHQQMLEPGWPNELGSWIT